MSEKEIQVSQRDKKYWIKAGVAVAHREIPDRKMIVDEILKKQEIIKDGDKETSKTFIVGVECHWFVGVDKKYDRGRFLTTELIKYGSNIKKPKTDPESFPKEIPSSQAS